MELIDSSKKKVKKICDVLVKETLEPAQKQAEEIVDEAHAKGSAIISEAKAKAEAILQKARDQVEEEKRVFESSVNIAVQKVITDLKDQIESRLFHPELEGQVSKYLKEKDVVVKLIDALVGALSKEGMKADLEVIVSNSFSTEEICSAILDSSLKAMKGETIQLAEMGSGVVVKCEGYNLSVDITDEAVKEIIARYASESLRKILFNQ